MNEIKIEHNIPLPSRRNIYRAIFSKMKEGDSILVESVSKAAGLRSCCIRWGIKITSRSVEGGVRIWKIAP